MNFNGLGFPQLQYNLMGAASGLAGMAGDGPAHDFFQSTYGDSNSSPDARRSIRLAERKRIAQELHDTLLQGFFAVSMQLHDAVDHLHPDAAVKSRFSSVLMAMDRVLEEGRRAVQGLRSSPDDSSSLGQTLAAVPGDMGFPPAVEFRVVVEGRARKLWEGLREDVYRIGREAIINAYRHSGARHIEAEIEYRTSGIRIVVRDDGNGIDPQVLQSGREGHWGLSGMKERAQGIGATLRILSRAGAGTEVELFVAARIAYETPANELAPLWLAALPEVSGTDTVSQSQYEQAQ